MSSRRRSSTKVSLFAAGIAAAVVVALGAPASGSPSSSGSHSSSGAPGSRPGLISPAVGTSSTALTQALQAAARGGGPASYGLRTLGLQGWQVQSTAKVSGRGGQISTAGYPTSHWLRVQPDDAGAPGTEIEALLQNGACPNVFYSDTMRKCFGVRETGKETVPQFAVPWWYRTTFTAPPPGQRAILVVNGIVGQADVWVNGTEVATQDRVQGAYTNYRFDVTPLLRPGTNTVAFKVYPNDPNSMFTVDNVDWTQVPPDQNTGIQFPVQLQTSADLELTDTHVNQQDAADLSSAALTVVGKVTNHSGQARTGTVAALVLAPDGGRPIYVSRTVTVPAATTETISLSASDFPALTVRHPQIWWPYQLGAQPLYTAVTALVEGNRLINSDSTQFGIRTVTSTLVGPSPLAPQGVRQYLINGRPLIIRGGGFSENLFLHYSATDTAHQITLLKGMGLNTLRLEGHFMPPDFYQQMDRAGILIASGYQCCDAWELPTDTPVSAHDLAVLKLSAATVAQRLRNHASVFTFQWSDNNPTPPQERVSLQAFKAEDLQVPIVASAEYKSSPQLGPAGEKEGPYDWVPPNYWYDRAHSDYADDSSLTNVGGSWALDSEQSAGHTIPTQDSMNRFLSPADQAKLWQDPTANQYHANAETGTTGYNFGTLYNFDTALSKRYGQWHGLAQYTEQAQVQNYEDVRAQFEAFIDHSTAQDAPSTGTIYWMANKGWPTLLWDLYNYDYDQAGSYFGAEEANRSVHALFTEDDHTVTLDNLTGTSVSGLRVEATVYTVAGAVVDRQHADGITLASQQVRNRVLSLHVPAATQPPETAKTYFVELVLSRDGRTVDRNVYWESTQPDVVDWPSTEGNPQATMTQYADLSELQNLAPATVQVTAHTHRDGAEARTTITLTNTSRTPTVAFFLRADIRRGTAHGTALPGDNQVRPVTWSSNDVTLWPGESETITASYAASALAGAQPVVSLYGWNVGRQVIAAS